MGLAILIVVKGRESNVTDGTDFITDHKSLAGSRLRQRDKQTQLSVEASSTQTLA